MKISFVILAVCVFATINGQSISNIKDDATCEKDIQGIASSFVDLLNDVKSKKWNNALTDVTNIVDHIAHVEAECKTVEPLFDSMIDLWVEYENVTDEALCKTNWKASFPNVIRLIKDLN